MTLEKIFSGFLLLKETFARVNAWLKMAKIHLVFLGSSPSSTFVESIANSQLLAIDFAAIRPVFCIFPRISLV
ncbi:hypothetical protein JCM30760_02060 [Thiomicrorhabdus hydrogeniphila]